MRKNQKLKSVALLLSSVLMTQSVLATPPAPTVDETLYVNLDYYGGIELANVVKTYTLNGNQTIKDEGVYSKVTNMTDMTKPIITDTGVTWEFKEPISRFYFEGKIEDVQLPWLFDVSYELNGVPTKAEDLAGAQGYVEIIIQVTPNQEADAYYLENMMLQIAATFNMDKCLSIEAEGAQIQTMGSSKMIMFMALPGETQTFKIGVGTESFETGGISMMMVPAKMKQLEMISGIAEQVPVLEQAAGAINNSLDIILGSVDSLQQSLSSTKEGIQEIYNGIEGTGEKVPEISTTHDQLMEELKLLLNTMDNALPQFETAKSLLDDVYKHGNNVVEIIDGTGRDLRRLEEAVNTLEDTLKRFKEMGEELGNVENKVDLGAIHTQIKTLQQELIQVHNQFYGLGSSLQSLQDGIVRIEEFFGTNALGQITWALGDATRLMNGLARLIGELDKSLGMMDNMLTQIEHSMQAYAEVLSNYKEDGEEGFEAIKDSVKEVGDLLSDVIELQEAFGTIGEMMNQYQEPLSMFLDTIEALATNIRNVLSLGITQVENVEGMIKEDGAEIGTGMKDALKGMIDTLDAMGSSLGQLQGIEKEKDVITTIMSNGWQQVKDMNLLKINPNAPIQSITSTNNASPETLQIIVRTKEISKGMQPRQEEMEEEAVEEQSLWGKIKQVINTILDNIKEILNKVLNKK